MRGTVRPGITPESGPLHQRPNGCRTDPRNGDAENQSPEAMVSERALRRPAQGSSSVWRGPIQASPEVHSEANCVGNRPAPAPRRRYQLPECPLGRSHPRADHAHHVPAAVPDLRRARPRATPHSLPAGGRHLGRTGVDPADRRREGSTCVIDFPLSEARPSASDFRFPAPPTRVRTPSAGLLHAPETDGTAFGPLGISVWGYPAGPGSADALLVSRNGLANSGIHGRGSDAAHRMRGWHCFA